MWKGHSVFHPCHFYINPPRSSNKILYLPVAFKKNFFTLCGSFPKETTHAKTLQQLCKQLLCEAVLDLLQGSLIAPVLMWHRSWCGFRSLDVLEMLKLVQAQSRTLHTGKCPLCDSTEFSASCLPWELSKQCCKQPGYQHLHPRNHKGH